MQFSATVEVKTMLAAVRRATTLIARSTLPVLNFLRLDGVNDRLTVSGTNCDCWLSSTFDAGHASGGVLVPGKDLESALAALPNGAQAKLTLEGTKLRMISGRSRFEFPTMDVRDWPEGADPERPTVLRVPAKEFMAAMESLRGAVSTDVNKYYLTGIFFDFSAARLVATNGFILGWEPMPWVPDGERPKSFIFPADAVTPLKKALEETDEFDLVIDRDAKRVAIHNDTIRFTTTLIDAQFPDYQRAIPPAHERAFRSERADVMTALARTCFLADDKTRAVTLAFSGGELTIKARDTEGGEAEDTCGARLISGSGDINVGVSSKTLQWSLDSLPVTTAVDFQFVDAFHAICVVGNSDAERRHLRVVMPVRMP